MKFDGTEKQQVYWFSFSVLWLILPHILWVCELCIITTKLALTLGKECHGAHTENTAR